MSLEKLAKDGGFKSVEELDNHFSEVTGLMSVQDIFSDMESRRKEKVCPQGFHRNGDLKCTCGKKI